MQNKLASSKIFSTAGRCLNFLWPETKQKIYPFVLCVAELEDLHEDFQEEKEQRQTLTANPGTETTHLSALSE